MDHSSHKFFSFIAILFPTYHPSPLHVASL
jgi:hypothetical protein